MQLEVSGFVANGKVVLCHLRLGGVKGHLIASKPALVTNHSSSVNGWTSKVKVNITPQVDILALVGSLDFATLLAVRKKKKNLKQIVNRDLQEHLTY